MYVYYNANPSKKTVGDCSVRAISKATNQPWEKIYMELCDLGLEMFDMPSSNAIGAELLKDYGFRSFPLCHQCRTVRGFCSENPYGTFVLGTGTHVVAVADGDYYDIFDSGDEIIVYAFRKER